jgi:hypothetical protein
MVITISCDEHHTLEHESRYNMVFAIYIPIVSYPLRLSALSIDMEDMYICNNMYATKCNPITRKIPHGRVMIHK